MVKCEHCHRKFSSYAALDQHFDRRHSNARKPTYLEDNVRAEKLAESRHRSNPYKGRGSAVKIIVFALILVIAVGAIAYAALSPPSQRVGKAIDVGSVAPDFSLTDTTGSTFTLSEYRGKSSVLLFFNEGLACSPCLQQMQSLDQFNQQFTALNVVVGSITADEMSALSSWVGASGPRYGRVMSDQSIQVATAYDMLGNSMHGTAPGHSFVLVNTSGVVVWRQDYYPPAMWVEPGEILTRVTKALGA